MERPIIYHPASGINRAIDGANSVQIDGVNFAWREQVFTNLASSRTSMQSAVIPDNIDAASNVIFRLVFRQVTAGVGNVIFAISERQHNPATDSRDQLVGWSLVTGAILPATAVPGTIDQEFTIEATVAAAGYTSNRELLSVIARFPTLVGDTFAGEVALVRYDIDFTQVDPASTGLWSNASVPGTIHYSLGNVGIGIDPPLESLHLSGAVIVGDSVISTDGTFRYHGGEFQGKKATGWVTFAPADTDWVVGGGNLTALAGSQVDIGLGAQTERLNVGGAVRLSNVAPLAATNGTISYSTVGDGVTLDFWARQSGAWVSMTAAGVVADWDTTTSPPDLFTIPLGNAGIGQAAPVEKLDVNGAIRIGAAAAINLGTIQWDGLDFLGRTGSGWVSLTAGASGGSTLGQAYNQGGLGVGRTISVIASAPVLITGVTPSGLRLDDGMYLEFGDPTVEGEVWYQAGAFRFETPANATSNIFVNTGTCVAGASGNVNITTGGTAGTSGNTSIYTGNSSAGNSGSVLIYTGSYAGTKGVVSIVGSRLQLDTHAANVGLRIPTKAGVPTDITGSSDGDVVVNTTAHTFYYRSGGIWRTPSLGSVSLDDAYNVSGTITVDAGAVTFTSTSSDAIQINQNVAGDGIDIDVSHSAANGVFATTTGGTSFIGRAATGNVLDARGTDLTRTDSVGYFGLGGGIFTSTPKLIQATYTGATVTSASSFGGVHLVGTGNTGAGFLSGVYMDSGWDYGFYSDSDCWVDEDRVLYFGGSDVTTNRQGGAIWLASAYAPDAFRFETVDRTSTGDTDQIIIETGDAADGDSGDLTIQTGTASATRGNLLMSGGSCILTASVGVLSISAPLTSAIVVSGASQALAVGTSGDGSYAIFRNSGAKSGGVGEVRVDTGTKVDTDTCNAFFGTGAISAGTSARVSGSVSIESGSCWEGSTGTVGIYSGYSDSTTEDTGDVIVSSGSCTWGTASGDTGLLGLYTGSVYNGTSGAIYIQSGTATPSVGTGNSGAIDIRSSDIGGVTTDGNTGNITLETGAVPGDGNTGNIVLNTQAVIGSGTRGYVAISGEEVHLTGWTSDRITLGAPGVSYLRIGHGAVTPGAVAGWDPGSLFINTAGVPALYINIGTVAAANFQLV